MLVFPYGLGGAGNSGGSSNDFIKSITYRGSGTATNTITFPQTPVFIYGIVNTPGTDARGYVMNAGSFLWGSKNFIVRWTGPSSGTEIETVSYNENIMTITGASAAGALNYLDAEYTIYYTT